MALHGTPWPTTSDWYKTETFTKSPFVGQILDSAPHVAATWGKVPGQGG